MSATFPAAAKALTDMPDKLRHLTGIAGLTKSAVLRLLSGADEFARARKDNNPPRTLAGKLIVNIFFESSTRTRTAFEASARQLGADVVNLDRITMAGDNKSESLADTIRTVSAMGAAGIVLRHGESGAAQQAAKAAPRGVAVINGGDGNNAHPTQGLADAYTIRRKFGDSFAGLRIAIVGDIVNSRVARSDARIFRLLGAGDIRLVGPPKLCPPQMARLLGGRVVREMDEGIDGCDIVVLLRMQRERVVGGGFFPSVADYHRTYGMTARRLKALTAKRREVMIMHPGPINRGAEIDNAVADGKHSYILRQVNNGMAVRMAVLTALCGQGGQGGQGRAATKAAKTTN